MARTLKPKQRQAAFLLAQGALAKDIEIKLNMRPNTLARWQQLPAFQAHIQKYAIEMQQAAHYKALAMRYASLNRLHHDIEYLREARPLEQIRKLLNSDGHLTEVSLDETRRTIDMIHLLHQEFASVGRDSDAMADGLARHIEKHEPHKELRWGSPLSQNEPQFSGFKPPPIAPNGSEEV